MTRVPIPKKLRFEVFKRDSFACQYCGRKAPDIVLHCDHVVPVASGGAGDILNLITSCVDCNLGKGARRLSDQATLVKQVDQLTLLNERREQLEMMINWRDGLVSVQDDAVQQIVDRIPAVFEPNKTGIARIKRWLKEFSVIEILSAIDESFGFYLKYEDDEPTIESWILAFNKTSAFLSIKKQEKEKPYIRRLLYIQGIIRNKGRAQHYNCVDYLEHLYVNGVDLDDLVTSAKRMRNGYLKDFEIEWDEWLQKIGKPF